MASSNKTRSRKRCSHNQPKLWADPAKPEAGPANLVSQDSADKREIERPWVLDDLTKERGRRGLAQVRRILAHTEPEQLDLFSRQTNPN